MQTAPLLPSTAPFAEEQIAALNRVISVTTAEQRAWLSGYLAGFAGGKRSAGRCPGRAAGEARAADHPVRHRIGQCRGAGRLRRAKPRPSWGSRRKSSTWRIFRLAQAAETENLLIVASTWGEGDPPQRAVDFYEALMAEDAPRFDKTRFAVLALGDRAYAQFCEIGRKIDERLAALGGARITDRIECDLDFETPATGWIDTTLELLNAEVGIKEAGASVIHVDFARPGADAPSRGAAVRGGDHRTCAPDRQPVHLRHAPCRGVAGRLRHRSMSRAIRWASSRRNDPALVDAVLKAAGLGGDDTLRGALIDRLDITTLTGKQIEDFARETEHHGAAGGLGGGAADHRPAGNRAGRTDRRNS